MAARLDLFHLRRHALLSRYFIFGPCRPTSSDDSGSVSCPTSRSRLIAAWHFDVDGRLACTWSAVPDDPA